MEKWIPAGLGSLVVVVLVWQSFTLSALNTRVQQLEAQTSSIAEAGSASQRPGRGLRNAGSRRRDGRGNGEASPLRDARDAPPRIEPSMRERIASLPPSEDPAALNLQDPQVREQVASLLEEVEEQRRTERDQERSARFKESMHQELSEFSEEVGLADGVRTQVQTELDRRSEAWNAVREDVRSGNMSWIDARREMEALREDSDATLTELLGEEDFQSLDERLWGDQSRRGPR